MAIWYRGLAFPQFPVSDGTPPKGVRNAEIRARHETGESIATLAEVVGITEQRIWKILTSNRRNKIAAIRSNCASHLCLRHVHTISEMR